MSDYNNRQLLCTFSNNSDWREISIKIKLFYKLFNNRIFIFENEKDSSELFLTYNVVMVDRKSQRFPNTILIHRKKQSNTLYSLNALNTLIKEENGELDSNYVLEWELYKNSLVISSDISVRIVPLRLHSIVDVT
jgi:hypothetical protein